LLSRHAGTKQTSSASANDHHVKRIHARSLVGATGDRALLRCLHL
jgi:hypothetical protein